MVSALEYEWIDRLPGVENTDLVERRDRVLEQQQEAAALRFQSQVLANLALHGGIRLEAHACQLYGAGVVAGAKQGS